MMTAISMEDDAAAATAGQAEESNFTRQESSRGAHLYEVLGLEKTATDDDIKRAYRRLALRYHPDKNLEGDATKTAKFQEINHANTVLSNPQKRRIYDEYGEMGLKMLEQFGDDDVIMRFAFKPWFKWTFLILGCVTCCCFGGCCCCLFCCNCCCNFCCGKLKPSHPDFNESGEWAGEPNGTMNGNGRTAEEEVPIVTSQPMSGGGGASPSPAAARHMGNHTPPPQRPPVIAMPPPPPAASPNGGSPVKNYGSTETDV